MFFEIPGFSFSRTLGRDRIVGVLQGGRRCAGLGALLSEVAGSSDLNGSAILFAN